jgi:hypothetical protein
VAEGRDYSREWYERNREQALAAQRARYSSDPAFAAAKKARARARYDAKREELKRKTRDYALANPEKMRAWRADWKVRNPEIVLEAGRQSAAKWRRENPDRAKASYSAWCKKNADKVNAHCAARRAREMAAMPAWADKEAIAAFYAEARRLTRATGVRHSVDHVWPLKHEKFAGLHVPWNLQVLTFSANSKKKNHIPELAGAI